MTREEAIKILQKLYEGCNKHKNTDLIKEAYNLAIEALKAQGTCEDAVSRQTLQKELALYPIDDVTSEDEAGYNRAINDIQKMLLHLPSTQPQSTMGQVNDTAQSTNDCISRRAAIDAPVKMVSEGIEWIPVYHLKDLPSAQPEPCADTISRKAAIDAILAVTGNSSVRELYEHVQEHGLSDMWSGGVNAAIDIIIAVPSAQPERKTGKWIERNPQNSDKCRLIECDQCGFSHIVGFNVPYEHWIESRNFCERCGADMRGEVESDGKDT